jgi:hypothetical protein
VHHAWERREFRKGFLWESLKERDHYEDTDVGGRIILKCILEKQIGMVCIELIGLRIRISGGLFCEQGNGTFGFHKTLGHF